MRVIIWILIILLMAVFMYAVSVSYIARLYFDRTQDEISKVKKMIRLNESLSRWLELEQKRVSIKEYFVNNDYETAAIYGMGDMGKKLFWELQREGVAVPYTLDKNIEDDEYKIIPLTDNLPDADVIIVTAVSSFNEIYLDLKNKFDGEIVNIEDMLWSV